MTARAHLLLVAVGVGFGTSSAAQAPKATVFSNGTVVPLDRERSLPNHSVAVQGDEIVAAGPVASVRVPAGATVADGVGKDLMPGDACTCLATGSEAIQTFSVPGFSIHNEMGTMVRSGLSPYQVYVTGANNAASIFGREDNTGKIREGLGADLVLVDADPLADVGNVAKPTGTMVRGRWDPRADVRAKIKSMN